MEESNKNHKKEMDEIKIMLQERLNQQKSGDDQDTAAIRRDNDQIIINNPGFFSKV